MTNSPQDGADPLSHSLSPHDLPDPRRSLDLLGLAQRGDRKALEELVGRYQDRLRRIVRIQLGSSSLRNEFESMDIVQGTFRAALPRIHELRPASAASLLRWLALIATNQIRDAHDRQTAAKRDADRNVTLPVLDRDAAVAAPSADSPERTAILREIREILDAAVSQLPDDQRRVVILRDYCGESWESIALELERDRGAARQLHQRAWINLRQALRPKLEGRG